MYNNRNPRSNRSGYNSDNRYDGGYPQRSNNFSNGYGGRQSQQRGNHKGGNQHDYTKIPRLTYVTQDTRIDLGKITKAIYDKVKDTWSLYFKDGASHTFSSESINKGAKIILSKYYYLVKVEDNESRIVKVNAINVVKAKLDIASDMWYMDIVGGESVLVADSIVNDGADGLEFDYPSIVTLVENDREIFKMNTYFISSIVRGNEESQVSYTVAYNDSKATTDVFYHSELTEAGIRALAKYNVVEDHQE